MRNCTYLRIVILFIILTTLNVYAGDDAVSVRVECFIQYEDSSELFKYSYKIANDRNSSKDIWTFDVQYQAPVEGLISPNNWEADFFKEKPIVDWTSIYKDSWIKPGNALSGLELKSKGLPAITSYYAQGWTPPPPPVAEGQAEEGMSVGFLENSIQGKTVGPTSPSADFKPTDFLNNIISMKHEAFKLGWIKNEGILKSLDAKLDNAKKDIEKGNTRSAKNTLKAFINEVEAQGCESYENCPSGKHLTSEAYGLLKYNALYLIDHL